MLILLPRILEKNVVVLSEPERDQIAHLGGVLQIPRSNVYRPTLVMEGARLVPTVPASSDYNLDSRLKTVRHIRNHPHSGPNMVVDSR